MLKAIIVEDEVMSQEILKNYLQKYCPSVELVAIAGDVPSAIAAIKANPCDLLFLDVEMPYGNAFDVLEAVGTINFQTVFVTAYQQYALDALNVHAAYYLLKPISIDELIKAVEYVEAVISKENTLQEQITAPKIKTVNGKITIGTQDGFEVLAVEDILYCKADDNYTEIYLSKGKRIVSKTLKYFEDSLRDYGFARVHKSYLGVKVVF